MARYYDLDKLLKLIEARADTMLEGKCAMLYVAKWLNLLSTADVVEVVRCKNCRYSNDDGTVCHYSVGRAVEPEHFCSYGTLKEKEKE